MTTMSPPQRMLLLQQGITETPYSLAAATYLLLAAGLGVREELLPYLQTGPLRRGDRPDSHPPTLCAWIAHDDWPKLEAALDSGKGLGPGPRALLRLAVSLAGGTPVELLHEVSEVYRWRGPDGAAHVAHAVMLAMGHPGHTLGE
ncbi:hypothetical protein [Streptosporangium sp. NPDC051022]|uniref:hypothetical protein n=1 Tax=Streptosporangium sp. NPDC051022 TaxID=3155752 RepID=UPI0034344B84